MVKGNIVVDVMTKKNASALARALPSWKNVWENCRPMVIENGMNAMNAEKDGLWKVSSTLLRESSEKM